MARRKQATTVPRSNIPLLAGVVGIIVMVGILIGIFMVLDQEPEQPGPSPGGSAEIVDGVQVVRVAVNGLDYIPSTAQVKAGMPVRFIMDGTNAAGCAQYFMFREFGLSKRLDRGENVFEFTPTKPGTYEFSCSMRMSVGYLQVV